MTKYFVVYVTRPDGENLVQNTILEQHPLTWLAEQVTEHFRNPPRLLWWRTLTSDDALDMEHWAMLFSALRP